MTIIGRFQLNNGPAVPTISSRLDDEKSHESHNIDSAWFSESFSLFVWSRILSEIFDSGQISFVL